MLKLFSLLKTNFTETDDYFVYSQGNKWLEMEKSSFLYLNKEIICFYFKKILKLWSFQRDIFTLNYKCVVASQRMNQSNRLKQTSPLFSKQSESIHWASQEKTKGIGKETWMRGETFEPTRTREHLENIRRWRKEMNA